MSLSSEITAAATEAQGILAQLGGMAATATGNFTGPDGKPYTLAFRSADAFESQAAGMEMQGHGYADKSVVIATGTRAQFDVAPLGWRRQKGTRLIPAPQTEALILSVATDDPLHYVFTLVIRQPLAPNG